MSNEQNSRSRLPWLAKLGICFGALAMLALLVGLGIKGWGRMKVAQEFDRIRAAGEPVSLEEMEFPTPGEGRDASEWVEELGGLIAEHDDLWCWDLTEFRQMYALVESREIELEDPVLQQEYFERVCAEMDADHWGIEYQEEMLAAFSDPRGLRDRTPFFDFHLHAMRRSAEPLLPHAFEVCSLGGFDFRRMLSRMHDPPEGGGEDSPGGTVPPLPAGTMQLFRIAALASAIDANGEQAMEALRAAFCAAGFYEGAHLLGGYDLWFHYQSAALELLEQALFLFPAEERMDGVEQLLDGSPPLEILRSALLTRRAFGIELYSMFAAAVHRGGKSSTFPSLTLFLWSDYYQLLFLERIRSGLAALDEADSTWELKVRMHEEDFRGEFPPKAVLAPMLTPDFEGWLDRALRLEAELQLAEIAITARREGRTAALERAAATRDPFDGAAIRSRVEDDGTLLFWSVGPDLLDHYGVADDLAWRVEARP